MEVPASVPGSEGVTVVKASSNSADAGRVLGQDRGADAACWQSNGNGSPEYRHWILFKVGAPRHPMGDHMRAHLLVTPCALPRAYTILLEVPWYSLPVLWSAFALYVCKCR